MAFKIKASSLAFLFVLIICLLSSIGEGFINYNAKSIHVLHKDATKVNLRKLLGNEHVMDYDYTGANPKHDPRKGKPKGP